MSSKTEITELRGVEVTIIDVYGDIPAYVVNADREIGITIHNMETDEPIFCLNKKEVISHLLSSDKNRQYHLAFNEVLRQIAKSRGYFEITFNSTSFYYQKPIFGSVEATCAFRK